MKSFPMFIDVVDQRVVIVGGGEQAAQKARLLGKSEARLALMAPSLNPELRALVDAGRAEQIPAVLDPAAFRGARMAFVATECAGADAAAAAVAKAEGVLVNVVDRPDLCDLTTPAIVDRDPVVVAIGTEGAAPVLARQIKTRVEEMLEPGLGRFAALAGSLRAAVAQRVPTRRRRAFWRWVFNGAPRKAHGAGDEAGAAARIEAAIAAGGETEAVIDGVSADRGFVSLIGAGPGSADLITLRGVQRLQEADVIFYDRLVDPGLLELARRDAERVYVGKRPGSTAWPQDRINGVIIAEAKAGRRVARLKCGDPLVFGRAAEEAAAMDAEGVAWEIVPGVTSALAAAAEAKVFPTERGVTQHLTLSTAKSAEGAEAPDPAAALAPGVTAAYYMGVAQADALEARLLDSGAPAATRVVIVEAAETARRRRLETTLDRLAETVRSEGVANPAILFVQRPLSEARQVEAPQVEARPVRAQPVSLALTG